MLNFYDNQDLKNLREDLMGELRTINNYQLYIDASQDEKMKEILRHIGDDEK